MKILSLFDGISCARVALERAGILVELYYASEVDKYAIQIASKNYPDTIQVGDVKELNGSKFHGISLPRIDLLIGGSPCQDLSIAKKERKGLDGVRSGLFWEYVRILKEVKPKYFILENVNSMPKEAKDTITKELGVEPIMINAALVSAQNRKRLFFCGQIRERLYFNDVLCYTCLQDENKGILGKTQGKRAKEILGETPARCCNMQNMPSGILEDKQAWNDKNLLGEMSNREQETKRLFKGQGAETKVSKNIPEKEQAEDVGVSKEISSIRSGERENENSRCQTSQKNSKGNADSLSKGTDRNKENDDKRGSAGNSEYETDMFCVSCHERLNNRPYRSFVSGWNEQPKQSPSIMSEVQFNEARQNNGRVFDIYQLKITQPEDRGIFLKDILQPKVDNVFTVKPKSNTVRSSGRGSGIDDKHNWDTIRIGSINKGGQGDRIYSPDGKSVGLSALGGGRGAKTGLYLIVPEATKKGYAVAEDGDSVDLSFPNSKTRRGRVGKKAKNLMTSNNIGVFTQEIIRKLTPVECERLQSLPDNYTDGVSNAQRYKCLGNAFNAEVVAHILKGIAN